MRIESYTDFNGKKSIDGLGFGNERLKWRQSYTTGEEALIIKGTREANLLNEFMNTPAPKNSSKEALNELEEMLTEQKDLTDQDMDFIEEAEDDLIELIVDYVKDLGIEGDVEDTLKRLADYTDPLLYKLKNHYNRPRPWQLARVLNVEMYPVIGTTASSASYPSGHALDAFNFARVLGELYPDHKAEITAFCDRAAWTRIQAGVHYKSDHDFSKVISDKLFEAGVLKTDMFK